MKADAQKERRLSRKTYREIPGVALNKKYEDCGSA
jgi:hypothetical protein